VLLIFKGRLKLWAGGDRITGVVHVDDLVAAMILAAEKGKPGEHYIISAGDLTTREMFKILERETGIPVPAKLPNPGSQGIYSIRSDAFSNGSHLSRERVHYVYDRCVRVDAKVKRQELNWHPRSGPRNLHEIVAYSCLRTPSSR